MILPILSPGTPVEYRPPDYTGKRWSPGVVVHHRVDRDARVTYAIRTELPHLSGVGTFPCTEHDVPQSRVRSTSAARSR